MGRGEVDRYVDDDRLLVRLAVRLDADAYGEGTKGRTGKGTNGEGDERGRT